MVSQARSLSSCPNKKNRLNNKILRTDSKNSDFNELLKHLDAELAIRDGDDHAFYDQFNKLDRIKHVVIASIAEKPVGCGALKKFDEDTVEIKRMFTLKEFRGKGLASTILKELEKWAKELNFKKCILETGINQPEAISLYKKCGYVITKNYGQYRGVDTSLCFQKILKQ